jgi:hypothetical protein
MANLEMMRAISEQNHRWAVLGKTMAVDPLLHSGNSFAWHVWLWWLDSFALIDAQRKKR